MAMRLELAADLACPWCRVGERHLEEALTESGAEIEVRWLPFRLNPDLPASGVPRRPYLERKFGSRVEAAHAPLEAVAEAEGWRFRFDLMETEPNMLDAHRLMLWAQDQDAVMALARRLFDAHWEEGRDLGNRDTLAALAGEAGLSRTEAADHLASDAGAREVDASQAALARAGIHGVPCFILDGRTAAQGALPVEALTEFLRRGAEGKLD
jgi:predicted DsbA family dithiol-disulfide isomerase